MSLPNDRSRIRIVYVITADRARPLWRRWAYYEYQYEDLEAALELEKRMDGMVEVYVSGGIIIIPHIYVYI